MDSTSCRNIVGGQVGGGNVRECFVGSSNDMAGGGGGGGGGVCR
jgi:hypothetical protein